MKIDSYAHILTAKYGNTIYKNFPMPQRMVGRTMLTDLDLRFRMMDKYDSYVQVLTVSFTPIEAVAGPKDSPDLARIANDEMAELIVKYPDRFIAAVAILPMNNMDAALEETDRAIKDLGLKGVLIRTPINGKPLDMPEFIPLYEKMAQYDLPIWIHPTREAQIPDYVNEERSLYQLYSTFGWPYETTLAMARLVFSGVLERYPTLKFITHHCGGMVPSLEQRITVFYGYGDTDDKREARKNLTVDGSKNTIEYFRMFYNDTALYGSMPGLMCGYAFFGADHLLFGTDMPYGGPVGDEMISATIRSVEEMDIPDSDKQKIFEDNARKILRLPHEIQSKNVT